MAVIDWPLPHRHKPVLDSFQIQAPSLLRRTEFEDGPDRTRRTATSRPFVYQAIFECTHHEHAALRRWVHEDADAGAAWFNLEAWIDGTYQWVEARIVPGDGQLYQAAPVDNVELSISLSYEVRELPRLGDADYITALIGGQDALALWCDGLAQALDDLAQGRTSL